MLPLPPRKAVGGGGLCALLDAASSARAPPALRAAGEQAAGRAAIVAGEEDDRVVAQAFLVECGDDAPDLIVEGRDHRGIGSPLLILDGFVAVLVFLRRLVGRVRRQRGEVEEERLLAVLLRRSA